MKFAKNDDVFVNSLFEGGSTCDGYFKYKGKRCIHLFDHQGKPIAFIAKNKHNESFLGNLSIIEGKPFYQVALTNNSAKHIGIDGLSFLQKKEFVENLTSKYLKG